MPMGVDTVKTTLGNAARIFLWEILIPAPIGGGNSEVLTARCQSTKLPGRSFGDILIPFKQTAGFRVPGKLTYSHNWDLEFIEGEDKKVFDAINAWQEAVISSGDGTGGGDTAIKQDIYLSLQTTDGSAYSKIKLIGCYPKEVADVDLNFSTEEVIKFRVTFSYDRWETA